VKLQYSNQEKSSFAAQPGLAVAIPILHKRNGIALIFKYLEPLVPKHDHFEAFCQESLASVLLVSTILLLPFYFNLDTLDQTKRKWQNIMVRSIILRTSTIGKNQNGITIDSFVLANPATATLSSTTGRIVPKIAPCNWPIVLPFVNGNCTRTRAAASLVESTNLSVPLPPTCLQRCCQPLSLQSDIPLSLSPCKLR